MAELTDPQYDHLTTNLHNKIALRAFIPSLLWPRLRNNRSWFIVTNAATVHFYTLLLSRLENKTIIVG